MAGKFLGSVPFAGDVLNAVITGTLGRHAGTPRAIPAAILTGLGGAAASAVTGGADFVPGMTDVVMTAVKAAKNGRLSPTERAISEGAAVTNPDRYIEKAVNALLEEKRYEQTQQFLKAARGMTSVPPSF